jgi:hypothetical protein
MASETQGNVDIGGSEIDAVEVVRGFLEKTDTTRASKDRSAGPVNLRSGRGFSSAVMGQMKEVGGPRFLAFVSLSEPRVTFLLNRQGFPESIPAIDHDGHPISRSEAKSRTVRLTLVEASQIASGIVRSALVDSEFGFEELCPSGGGLQDRGSLFVYEFSWTECVDERGNARFLSRVSVEINPTSGEMISYKNQTSAPKIDMSTEDIFEQLEALDSSLEEFGHVEVLRRIPFRYWHDDGTPEDACEIEFRRESDESEVSQSVVVSLQTELVLARTKDEPLDSGIWDASAICP